MFASEGFLKLKLTGGQVCYHAARKFLAPTPTSGLCTRLTCVRLQKLIVLKPYSVKIHTKQSKAQKV